MHFFDTLIVAAYTFRIFSRGISYNAHGAQITPPPLPLFLIIVYFYFYAYIRLGQVKVRFALQGQKRGLVRAPQDQSPSQGLELEKNEKTKLREEVNCAPRTQQGRVLIILFMFSFIFHLLFSNHKYLDLAGVKTFVKSI